MGSHMINILVELNRLTCTTLSIMSCDDSERQLTLIVDLSKLLTCHNCCPVIIVALSKKQKMKQQLHY